MSELSEIINKTQLASSIKTINDIFVNSNEIIKSVQLSHEYDPICVITIDLYESYFHKDLNSHKDIEPKNVISGSKAVTAFLELLRAGQKKAKTNDVKGCGPFLKLAEHYKSNDVDVFFLDSKEVSRIKYENVDIIHLKIPNITQHLDNFDLACCRTSMNLESTKFWISLNCLYTMLTGHCFIPKYLESLENFKVVYMKANKIYDYNKKNTDRCKVVFTRTQLRIEKYTERGYTFQYVETDKVLSFISSNHMNSYLSGY
jgi:hypothetical protein